MLHQLSTNKISIESDRTTTTKILPGKSFPLGATVYPDGVNFCVYSRANAIELLLFDRPEASQPYSVITLDPKLHSSCYYWHVFIPGMK
ncbi:MAG: hypothetical protein AAGK10_16175, partial [Cyanobacteria bacterium J06555_3]